MRSGNVHLGVDLPIEAAYDLGDPHCWYSDDSCRKILEGRDVGSDEGISPPKK